MSPLRRTRTGENSKGPGNEPFRWVLDTLDSDDLRVDRLLCCQGQLPIAAVYLETLVDQKRLVAEILEPLEWTGADPTADSAPERDRRRRLGHARRSRKRKEILEKLLMGHVALFAPGQADAYLVPAPLQTSRDVSEATTEVQLLGPKAAFTEELPINLQLVRRRLHSPDVRVKLYRLGRRSRTGVALVYMDGIANAEFVQKITRALTRIDVDFIRGSNDISELIFGRSLTPFPLSQRTERPDRVVEALADGRIAVLVDGTPFPLLVPTTLHELQRDGEAFLGGSLISTGVRWLRNAGILTALITPALYAAILGVDPNLLPPDILLAVAATREGIPYPVLFETLVFVLLGDLVAEAIQQSPAPIGQTLTIVGSLIVGQAAVQARLASQLMVIVLALTSMGTLLSVNLPLIYAMRASKYPIIILGGVLGIFGVTLGIVALTVHLASLKSFGVPYLSPMGPVRWTDLLQYTAMARAKGARTVRPQTFRPEDDVRAPRGGKGTQGAGP